MIFIMIFIHMNKRTNIQYNFNLSNNMMAKQIKKKYIFSTTSKCFKNECQTYKKNSSKFQIVI